MSLRVLDGTGTGDVASAVEAIDYAADHGAQVINCPWGTDGESISLREAIRRAGTRGAVVVSSAGNGGRDIESQPYYPSSFGLPNQISVASTDNFDRFASWSNHGGAHVTVAAPLHGHSDYEDGRRSHVCHRDLGLDAARRWRRGTD